LLISKNNIGNVNNNKNNTTMAFNKFEGGGPKKWGAKRLQEWIELQSNKEMMFYVCTKKINFGNLFF